MTPNDILGKRFEKKMGGYRADEVHAYLEQVAAYAQGLLDEKNELEAKMAVLAEKLEEYREDEDSLRAALIGAQKLGDSVVRDAKKKAEMLLAEASAKAEELVSDAKSNIDKEALALNRMQGQVAEFKTQILNLYKRHIEMIKSIPDEHMMPRDVKQIVEQAVDTAQAERAAQVARAQTEAEEAGDDGRGEYFLSYEDMEIPLNVVDDAELAEAAQKHKRFGDLRFGEEYNLTRKE